MDRSPRTSSCERKGGELIAVRKDILSSLLFISNQLIEQIFIRFFFEYTYFIVSNVYLPPQCPIDSYTTHLFAVDELTQNHLTFLYFFIFN